MGRKKRQRRVKNSSCSKQNDDAIYASITTATASTKENGNADCSRCNFDTDENCYSQILRHFGHKEDEEHDEQKYHPNQQCGKVASPPPLPLNWLNTMYTLNRSSCNSTTTTGNSTNITKRNLEDQLQLQQHEIQNLAIELNSIKHLLWPSAIKTSQTKNRISSRKRKRKKDFLDNLNNSNSNTNGGNNFYTSEKGSTSASTLNLKSKATSPSIEFRLARERSNPFEKLGNQKWLDNQTKSFVCRSAMKLANIDAILGFILTVPAAGDNGDGSNDDDNDGDGTKERMVKTNQYISASYKQSNDAPFKFVDLCGAPGGFSEYILRRFRSSMNHKKDSNFCCSGYGMSLIGTNDDGRGAKWDLDTLSRITNIHENDNERSKNLTWKVCNGDDGTGDIYNWKNVIKLQNDIRSDHNTKKTGKDGNNHEDWKVDLAVADGGFDAQRDSECQESLAHQIVTCQTAAALSLLKKGGIFVVKMFGFQKSRKLILYHLYNSFEKLIFLKPVTSRPASAERYVVCLNYNGLDPSFDLLSWRDDVAHSEEESEILHTNTYVDSCLDSIDRDMLQLNFQACAEIVSILREEELLTISNKDSQHGPKPIDFSFYHKYFQIEF